MVGNYDVNQDAFEFQFYHSYEINKIFSHDTDQKIRIMRKTDFCLCENKGADQLCSNCFCFSDSTISLLLIFEISSL